MQTVHMINIDHFHTNQFYIQFMKEAPVLSQTVNLPEIPLFEPAN